jgi:sRNA-binding protein
MSDPRVDLLAKHIASVLVTLIDIARDGQSPVILAAEQVAEAQAQVQEEPAKRRGRPPKADAVPAAADSSADDPATPASELGTATAPGTQATGDATTADTLAIAQELTIKLVQAKGRDTAVAALGDFNVAKASALAADQISAYCEAVRELLAA